VPDKSGNYIVGQPLNGGALAGLRIQSLSLLLTLCGVCRGGLASASPVGRLGLARPLGRPKSERGAGVVLVRKRKGASEEREII